MGFILSGIHVTTGRRVRSRRSSSRKLGQRDNQGMRDGFHTIRDSFYHREKGAEKTLGGMAANTSKVR